MYIRYFLFFFFQAEDGIRDRDVTGVQTCALPISSLLKGEHEGSFSSDVVRPMLNGEAGEFFLARLERARGDPILFEIDPGRSEAVQLFRSVSRLRWGTNWAVVTRFPEQRLAGAAATWAYRDRLGVPRYTMDVRLTPTGGADLDFAASATLTVIAEEAVGPWLLFRLHPKLQIDSARFGVGAQAATFKAKDDDDLWVNAGRRLQPGDTLQLTLAYHG